MDRRDFTLAGTGALALAALPFGATAQGGPLRIGSTLSLTGPLGPQGITQRLVGEYAVEDLNKRGGLLGRQVEWIVRDDQSRPDLTRTLYEQLVTADKVDLILGPYGTGAILSAMGVAQRHNKVLLHNSFGIPNLAKYEMQFSTGGLAGDPENTVPKLVFDALAAAAKPPQTVAIVTSKFPSVHFISIGAREAAKRRNLKEALWLEWDFGNRDFGPIAARLRDAKADFVWAGSVGIESSLVIEAMTKIDYAPPLQFHMFPAAVPLARTTGSRGALALTVFEEHPPFTDNPAAARLVTGYRERATKANLPDAPVELIGSIAYATWQVLEAAVNGAKSVDDKQIAAWLKRSQVDTIIGRLRWDGPQNYIMGTDHYKLKQLQDGRWRVVWPRETAAPGASLQQG